VPGDGSAHLASDLSIHNISDKPLEARDGDRTDLVTYDDRVLGLARFAGRDAHLVWVPGLSGRDGTNGCKPGLVKRLIRHHEGSPLAALLVSEDGVEPND
jgi:hypothetical protein